MSEHKYIVRHSNLIELLQMQTANDMFCTGLNQLHIDPLPFRVFVLAVVLDVLGVPECDEEISSPEILGHAHVCQRGPYLKRWAQTTFDFVVGKTQETPDYDGFITWVMEETKRNNPPMGEKNGL